MFSESYAYQIHSRICIDRNKLNPSTEIPRYCASCEQHLRQNAPYPRHTCGCRTKDVNEKLWDKRWERWWGYNWAREQRKSTRKIYNERKPVSIVGGSERRKLTKKMYNNERKVDCCENPREVQVRYVEIQRPTQAQLARKIHNNENKGIVGNSKAGCNGENPRKPDSEVQNRYVELQRPTQSLFFPPLPRKIQAEEKFSERIRQITKIGKSIQHDLLPEMHKEYLNICYRKVMATPCNSVNNFTNVYPSAADCDKAGFRKNTSSQLESWVRIHDYFTSSEGTDPSNVEEEVRSCLLDRKESPYEDKLKYLEKRISLLEKKQNGRTLADSAESNRSLPEAEVTYEDKLDYLERRISMVEEKQNEPLQVRGIGLADSVGCEDSTSGMSEFKYFGNGTCSEAERASNEGKDENVLLKKCSNLRKHCSDTRHTDSKEVKVKRVASSTIVKQKNLNIKNWFPHPSKKSPFWAFVFGRRSKASVQSDDFVISKSCQLKLEKALLESK